MKKLGLLLLSVVALGTTMVSCEKDEDTNSGQSVVGTWKFSTVEVKINGQSSGPQDPNPTCSIEGKVDSVTFKADKSYTSIGYDPEDDCSEYTDAGAYVVSADGKTMTIDGEEKMNIVKVTATDMVLSQKITEEGVTYTFILNLKK